MGADVTARATEFLPCALGELASGECLQQFLTGIGKKAIGFGEVSLDKATEYGAEDADGAEVIDSSPELVTVRLFDHDG